MRDYNFSMEGARALKYQNWKIAEPDPAALQTLRQGGCPLLLSAVLAARGVSTLEEARALVRKDRTPEFSPLLMKDMDKAVARIRLAMERGETVAVFGDYDADGITSTVLLTDYLKSRGVPCLRHIPRRTEDGYGLSKTAIAALREQGAALLVSVDCGVTGSAEVAYANALGMDVVVTDHHECKDALPEAAAVVDPHRPDCPYPFKHLAGCGVALKLVLALGGPEKEGELFERYAPLAAVGTVADVMRMEGENRTIVRRGLEALPHTEFAGLLALLKETGLSGKAVTSTQAGFTLAPRINAAGRMGRVDLALALLESRDSVQAEELAKQLCALNRERQAVEQAIFADAEKRIQKLPPDERRALVLASDQWHPGVIGIVASRLSEKYACPTVMICLKGGIGKGSCRSWGGLNLFAALESCADVLEQFGGHALAAGVTISKERIGVFRKRLNQYVRAAYGAHPPVSALEIDAELSSPAEATPREVRALDCLEPYGSGNPQPVFALTGAVVEELRDVGEGRHLKLRLSKGAMRFDGIFFSMTAEACGLQAGELADAAFYLQINTFRDTVSVQLQVLDMRPSQISTDLETESLDLIRRLISGGEISAPEAARLRVSRERFAACWRALDRFLRETRAGQGAETGAGQGAAAGGMESREAAETGARETDALPFLRFLAGQMGAGGGGDAFLHAALALEVFRERGLIEIEKRGNRLFLSSRRAADTAGGHGAREKVNLEECPYLARLRTF